MKPWFLLLLVAACGQEVVELVSLPAPEDCEVCDGLGDCRPAADGTVCSIGSCLDGMCTASGDCESGERFVAVAAGEQHTCGLGFAGDLYCWGRNDEGQLGTGDSVDLSEPTPVGALRDWQGVAAGWKHSLGLRRDGSAYSWGRNGEGELGLGDRDSPRMAPEGLLGGESQWQNFVGGERHSCGLGATGSLWCWGQDRDGELGLGSPTARRVAPEMVVEPAVDWREVSAGGRHTCGVDWDGRLWCWGNNDEGQLGTGDTNQVSVPTEVGASIRWKGVSAGTRHTCALDADRVLYCWGRNRDGEAGAAEGGRVLEPAPVLGVLWSQLALGERHSCGIAADGALFCWGRNDVGQLGLGGAEPLGEPTRLGAASDWVDVRAGRRHTCALRSSGALFCFGQNDVGQLGLGDLEDRALPSQLCPSRAVE